MSNPSIEIIRSRRTTVTITVKSESLVVMRVPYQLSESEIHRILQQKQSWIQKKVSHLRQTHQANIFLPYSPDELHAMTDWAYSILSERLKYFAPLIGVTYQKLTIRKQVSRWGSCSSNGNLNFNCLLALCPPEVIDYVVVHELCHLKQMNHSPLFWTLVEGILPNYKESQKWLRIHECELMGRLRESKKFFR